ncbi:PsiF family protein [Thiomonas bhubaneswarensis]|uniref:PsiF repeat n=1 Tax=Thiomonas bhubaneswarensis TaxID=339866 RepID=A0A0K6HWV3_9BURK|nr:PsiF family protein [Thiomonas bhubaneswarensis]CUA95512.1 psiF repeat [Thiomonas bhubaneswarensis]
MKKLIATLGLALGLLALPMVSQAQNTPQQSRMAQCNKEATGKTGDARKAFMKECLAAKPAATEAAKPAAKEAAKPEKKAEQKAAADGKKLTPQQEKMSFCSKDAKAKGLKGEERKKFMSECLRKK